MSSAFIRNRGRLREIISIVADFPWDTNPIMDRQLFVIN